MTRQSRVRSKVNDSVTGTYTLYPRSTPTGSSSHTTNTITRTGDCSDSHGRPIVPSLFSSSQGKGVICLDGYAIDGDVFYYNKFDRYPIYKGTAGSDNTLLTAPNGWVASIVARTNPSRASINSLELLQDLYDLPKMIFGLRKFLEHPKTRFSAKGAANSYLEVTFGWLPLIEDIRQIANLQSIIAKRGKELDQLYSGRGLRRRVQLGSDTKTVTTKLINSLSGTYVFNVNVSATAEKTSWATIRWHPTSPPPYHPGDGKRAHFLRNLALGWTPEGLVSGAWKVLPWTWLIGWFTNIGAFTLQHSNTVPATWSDACFMSQVTTTTQVSGITKSSGTKPKEFSVYPSGTATLTTKSRSIGSGPTLGVNMPYLDMSKLSVLGALAIQRFR